MSGESNGDGTRSYGLRTAATANERHHRLRRDKARYAVFMSVPIADEKSWPASC
jgi:hypothetical protein